MKPRRRPISRSRHGGAAARLRTAAGALATGGRLNPHSRGRERDVHRLLDAVEHGDGADREDGGGDAGDDEYLHGVSPQFAATGVAVNVAAREPPQALKGRIAAPPYARPRPRPPAYWR